MRKVEWRSIEADSTLSLCVGIFPDSILYIKWKIRQLLKLNERGYWWVDVRRWFSVNRQHQFFEWYFIFHLLSTKCLKHRPYNGSKDCTLCAKTIFINAIVILKLPYNVLLIAIKMTYANVFCENFHVENVFNSPSSITCTFSDCRYYYNYYGEMKESFNESLCATSSDILL